MNNIFFETIKCEDYEVFNIIYHKKRIANTIGLNLNLEEYIYPPSDELLKCKVIYDQDGIIDINYSPYKSKEIKTIKMVYNDTIEYKYKSANRDAIDKLNDKKDIFDEIIIVKNGLVTDTSIANIAILIDKVWYTPKAPLLYGTTRQRYLESSYIKECDIDLNLFAKRENLAVLNAMVDFKIIENCKVIL